MIWLALQAAVLVGWPAAYAYGRLSGREQAARAVREQHGAVQRITPMRDWTRGQVLSLLRGLGVRIGG